MNVFGKGAAAGLLIASVAFGGFAISSVQGQVIVGTQDFSITVEQANVPNAFSLPPMSVYIGEFATSDPVILTGFTGPLPITVSGTGVTEYSLNGGEFTSSPGEVIPGDTLVLRVASSGTAGQVRTGTVTIGGVATTMTVTSSQIPSTTVFSQLYEQTLIGVPVSTWFESRFVDRILTVQLNDTPFSVSSGMEYKLRLVGSGDFLSTGSNNLVGALPWQTAPQTLTAGTYELLVRVQSSDQYETTTVETLSIGPFSRSVSLTTTFDPSYYSVDPFTIADATGTPDQLISSQPITISGLSSGRTVDFRVSGTTGRQVGFSVNGGAFSAATRPVSNGDNVVVQIQASPFNGGISELLAEALDPAGQVRRSGTFTVTTVAPTNQTVDTFAFNWQYFPQTYFGSFPGDIYQSEIITLSGGTGTRPLRVLETSGHYNSGTLNRWPRVYGSRIYYQSTNTTITTSLTNDSNALMWSTANSNYPNIVTDVGRQIRMKYAPGNGSNETYSVLCVGATCAEHIWTNSATRSDPRAADPFSIADVTGAEVSTLYVSEPVTVSWPARTSGAQAPNIPISVSGSGSPEYRINGGAWTNASGWVGSGSTVELRLTSASTPGTDQVATLSVGTTSSTYVVRTEDLVTPDAFTIVAANDVAPNALVASDPIIITGITTSVPVSVSGDGSPLLSVNGGEWLPEATVGPNGEVRVRLTSAPAYEAGRTVTLDVNGVTGTFSATTAPFTFALNPVTEVLVNASVTSDPVMIPVFLTPSPISVSGDGSPSYSLNGGTFTSEPGTITGGDVLLVRVAAPSTKDTEQTTTVTIGSASSVFSVRTAPPDACETGPVGTVCADGAVYAGIANGHRIFAAPSSVTNVFLKSTATVTMGSIFNDGLLNHHATTLAGIGNHPAAAACAAMGPEWVLPSLAELQVMYNNRTSAPAGTYVLSGTTASRYWASTENASDPRRGNYLIFSNGSTGDASKNSSYQAHCIRYSREEPRVYQDPCASGIPSIGTMCADGAVYAGIAGGNHVFLESTVSADGLAYKTSQTLTPGTETTTNSLMARLAMDFAGLGDFPGQSVCAAKGVSSYGSEWYLPVQGDLQLLGNNNTLGVLRQMSSSNASGSTEVPRYLMTATEEADQRYAVYFDKHASGGPAVGTSTTYRSKTNMNKAVLCMRYDQAREYVPNNSGFTSLADVDRGVTITFDPITVSGINAAVPVFISPDFGAQYQINSGVWRSDVTSVTNGSTIRVRFTSPLTSNTSRSVTLTVGSVPFTAGLTTRGPGPITLVGSVDGTTSATLPAHQEGDLIIAFAFRSGNTTAPTMPAGWTNLSNAGANASSGRVAYRVATGPGTLTGTFTNASRVIFLIYRNAAISTTVATATGSSTSVTYGANSAFADGGRTVLFMGHRSTNAGAGLPTGMTSIRSTNSTARMLAADSGVTETTGWGASTVAVGGTASGWRTFSLRLRPD